MTIPALEVPGSMLAETDVLTGKIDEYFAPVKSALNLQENCFITTLNKGISVDGKEIIYDYGTQIYTLSFVDGNAVKIASRSEAGTMERAQVMEVTLATSKYSEVLTENINPAYVQILVYDADFM